MSAPPVTTLRGHDENFPLLFTLLERSQRRDLATIYGFCRSTDDLGDESPGDRLAHLEQWGEALDAAFAGKDPGEPLLVALADVVRRRSLDAELFRQLVEANRMDQRQRRWATEADLFAYCAHSAMPVGRMVLGVLGEQDERLARLSDATCTGLQLVNFWQDVRRDLDERDRIYIPAEHLAQFRVAEEDLREPGASPEVRSLIAFEIARTRRLFQIGAPLAGLVSRRARPDIAMFTAAGEALCDRIARAQFDTLRARPRPGSLGRARIVLGVARHLIRPR